MFTGKKIIFPLSVILFLLWTASAFGGLIAGPDLTMAETNWQDFGLLIRAENDVTLVSVRYPNRGLADVVQLRRNSDSAVLASVLVPAGNADFTVNINVPLTSQEVYTLVATTPNNRYFGFPGVFAFPTADSDITVLASYYGGDYEGIYYGFWFSFNDIVTEAGTPGLEAVIDIKPGSDVNSINLKSKGVVPVAILTTEDFDAMNVNPQSVMFAGAHPVRGHVEDVDGDGSDDILLQFKTQELTELSPDSTDATLSGATLDEIPFSGTDTVNIVPGK